MSWLNQLPHTQTHRGRQTAWEAYRVKKTAEQKCCCTIINQKLLKQKSNQNNRLKLLNIAGGQGKNGHVTLKRISGQYSFLPPAGKVTNLGTPIFYPQRSFLLHLNWGIVNHVRVHCVTYMTAPALAAVAWTGVHIWAHPEITGMSECFFLDLNVGFHIPHSSLAFYVLSDLPEIQCQTILTALWSQHCRHFSKTKH